MKKLKNLFLKLSEKFYRTESPENKDIVAYFDLKINSQNEISINCDFNSEFPNAIINMAFLLSSGNLSEYLTTLIEKRYEDKPEIALQILESLVEMLRTNNNNNDDSDEPVIDPCNVLGFAHPEQDANEEFE